MSTNQVTSFASYAIFKASFELLDGYLEKTDMGTFIKDHQETFAGVDEETLGKFRNMKTSLYDSVTANVDPKAYVENEMDNIAIDNDLKEQINTACNTLFQAMSTSKDGTSVNDDEGHTYTFVKLESSNTKPKKPSKAKQESDDEDDEIKVSNIPAKKNNKKGIQSGLHMSSSAPAKVEDDFDDSGDEDDSASKKKKLTTTKKPVNKGGSGTKSIKTVKTATPTSTSSGGSKNDTKPIVTLTDNLYEVSGSKDNGQNGKLMVNSLYTPIESENIDDELADEITLDITKKGKLDTDKLNTLINNYKKIYVDSLKAMPEPKKTSNSKSEKKLPTAKDVNNWFNNLSQCIIAENSLLESDTNISKIEIKKFGAKIDTKMLVVTTKGEKKNTTNQYIPEDMFTEECIEQIKGNFKATAVQQKAAAFVTYVKDKLGTTPEELKKKGKLQGTANEYFANEIINGITRLPSEPEDDNEQHLVTFYNTWIYLKEHENVIKAIKVDPIILLTNPNYINTINILNLTFDTSVKNKFKAEDLFYKLTGLVIGGYVRSSTRQEITPSRKYYYSLGYHLDDFKKPLTTKTLEQVFISRFAFLGKDDSKTNLEYEATLHAPFAQAASNLKALSVKKYGHILNAWIAVVSSVYFIHALACNLEFSKTFHTLFKQLYNNKESLKLYLTALYPISFLFTPFMASFKNAANVKAMDKTCNGDKGKKAYSTNTVKTLVEFIVDKYDDLDWCHFMNADNCNAGERLTIMSVLYQKFDKAEDLAENDEEEPANDDDSASETFKNDED